MLTAVVFAEDILGEFPLLVHIFHNKHSLFTTLIHFSIHAFKLQILKWKILDSEYMVHDVPTSSIAEISCLQLACIDICSARYYNTHDFCVEIVFVCLCVCVSKINGTIFNILFCNFFFLVNKVPYIPFHYFYNHNFIFLYHCY